jgi:hypothetical protein
MNNALAPLAPASLTTSKTMGLMPQNLDEALRLADILARSSLVPRDYQGNPGNALVAIQWGCELGLPPLQAMQNIAVINGRPSLWGDSALALVRGSGLLEAITETVTATEAVCVVKRKGEAETSRTFTLEDAKRAGLAGKAGPWAQYPKRMLQMRARAWALRDVFPDVLRGVHVAEEAQDIPVERAMGAVEVIPETTPTQSRTAAVKAKLAGRLHPTQEQGPETTPPAAAIDLVERLRGLPVVRVKSAIMRKFPGRYAKAGDMDLGALADDEAVWVEQQLPHWQKAMKQEAQPATPPPATEAAPTGVVDGASDDWGDGIGGEGQGVTK